jgi:hypothetical protein
LLLHDGVDVPPVLQLVDDNLDFMSARKLADQLITTFIPQYMAAEELDPPPVPEKYKDILKDTPIQWFLCSCGLKTLCEMTCLDILHFCGLTYDYHQKCFYTNNHEKYINKRIKYVWHYLDELEPYFPVYVPASAIDESRRAKS